jgi:CRP-like cAMP-binding protein
MLWVDIIGVFPFYAIALAIAGEMGENSKLAQYLALLRLARLVRLHRMKQLFDNLQYNAHISLMTITLTRNLTAAVVWSHFWACLMYFIALQHDFNEDDTWIGGSFDSYNRFERYITSLYWSVTTFTTVGYGDFSPSNEVEQIFGMIYMLLNIIIQSWIIGSITLLIVKQDEKTGDYRESLKVLDQYAQMHNLPKHMHKRLKQQLRLEFNNREIADEAVLQHFPVEVRRKVLRRLYLPALCQTQLMKGLRQQFADAFLTSCHVEIFSANEELLQRGSVSSDLYLLVGGCVTLVPWTEGKAVPDDPTTSTERPGSSLADRTSIADSTTEFGNKGGGGGRRDLQAGEFINEIGFFTESPQTETVRTKTVVKTLTMSKSAYKLLSEEHPGSVGKVLQNLLEKVEEMAAEAGKDTVVGPPLRMEILRAGSIWGDAMEDRSEHLREVQKTVHQVQSQAALTAVQDLVRMHMNKQKDDHTTRFLFAASRGDTATIQLMCEQGFDPNSADYDYRTALMVASMKGNTEAVNKLLEFQANPSLCDMHGSSALYEAASNGHEDTMEVLLEHGAALCMDEGQAASTLCSAVFDGDMVKLRRLLKAKCPVNAADYDKRTAAHIAAAEGNVSAVKVLVEFGADLSLQDRWGHKAEDEAKRVNAGQLLAYLKTLKQDDPAVGKT